LRPSAASNAVEVVVLTAVSTIVTCDVKATDTSPSTELATASATTARNPETAHAAARSGPRNRRRDRGGAR
jgi:hypothetical protein